MSVVEKKLENDIVIQQSARGLGRLFRNNTGTGWVANKPDTHWDKPSNTVTLRNPRPLHAGLVNGGCDTIGWTEVKITPAMVGKTVAVFTAIEIKDVGKKPSPDQKIFIGNVTNANGIVGIAYNKDDHLRIVSAWLEKISYT
jgi:hypothetical protein